MKKILISIKPEFVMDILMGRKTIEIRKSAPKEWVDYLLGKTTNKPEPTEVFIYCCKDKGSLYEVIHNGEETEYGINDSGKSIFVKVPSYKLGWGLFKDKNGKTRDILNELCGHVVAKFTLNNVEIVECNNVPYSEKAYFGYGYYLDKGVYFNPYVKEYEKRNKPYKCDNGLVFERKYTKSIAMLNNEDFERMCLKPQEIFKYLNYNFGDISLWHIDDLQIFDRPFSLYEQKIGNSKTGIAITKAPQSWRYCEYDENNGFLPF